MRSETKALELTTELQGTRIHICFAGKLRTEEGGPMGVLRYCGHTVHNESSAPDQVIPFIRTYIHNRSLRYGRMHVLVHNGKGRTYPVHAMIRVRLGGRERSSGFQEVVVLVTKDPDRTSCSTDQCKNNIQQ